MPRALQERLRSWRRTIHRHPELSYTEERTAKLVQTALADLGIRFEGGVAKTGVVGHIQGDPAGPTVGLRADMDALPILEENGSEFDYSASRAAAKASSARTVMKAFSASP